MTCNGNGLCREWTSPAPACECLVGFEGDQCGLCSDNFHGFDCEPCPGGGSRAEPAASLSCGVRGACDDGILGNGTCACDAPFDGAACEDGECASGSEYAWNDTTSRYACATCAAGYAKNGAGPRGPRIFDPTSMRASSDQALRPCFGNPTRENDSSRLTG